MYIYIYISIHTYIHTHTHIYIYIHIYIYNSGQILVDTQILEGHFGSFWGCLDSGRPWLQIQLALNTQGRCPHCVALDNLGHHILLFPLERKVCAAKARYDGRHGEILRHKEGHHPSA